MLSTPKHGWVDLTIGSWSDRASYLTEVPFELLDALIRAFTTYSPTCAKFDAEGWEYIIVFDRYDTHVIEYKDDVEFYSVEIGLIEIAKEIHTDISNNLKEWSLWTYDTEDEDARISREKKLSRLLSVLNDLLPNNLKA